MKNVRIAILDMYKGVPNEGMRCIKMLVEKFYAKNNFESNFEIFDIRLKNEIPDLNQFDCFISTGGPGSPLLENTDWEKTYFRFIEDLIAHNKTEPNKKHLLAICHSFQLLYQYFELGEVTKRRSTSFGVMPMHKFKDADSELIFKGLEDPFWAVDSRDYQAIKPNKRRFKYLDATILCIEKKRPHVELERAIMAIRFTPELIGTQFHPEADAEGMHRLFLTEEKKKAVIENFGERKYLDMIDKLDDPDKIMLTESIIIPNFLEMALEAKYINELV